MKKFMLTIVTTLMTTFALAAYPVPQGSFGCYYHSDLELLARAAAEGDQRLLQSLFPEDCFEMNTDLEFSWLDRSYGSLAKSTTSAKIRVYVEDDYVDIYVVYEHMEELLNQMGKR